VENSKVPNLVSTGKPKLNVQTVSSAVFGKEGGSAESMKNVHGTMSDLAGHVRKAVVRIGALEKKLLEITNRLKLNEDKTEENVKKIKINQDKTEDTAKKVVVLEKKVTIIKNILKNQKGDIGKKLPGKTQDNTEKTLVETNKILVQIQKELSKAFGIQSSEDRRNKDRMRRNKSRKKLGKEESGLESSARSLGESVSGAAENIVSPIGNIFSKIMDFLGIMLLGIASNFVFEWLGNPENMEKVSGWWNWIKDHWQWVAAGIGALMLLPLIGAITGVLGPIGLAAGVIKMAMMPLIGLLFNPLFWKALLIIGAGVLLYKAGEAAYKGMRNASTGGSEFSAAHDVLDQKLRDAGLDQDGKKRDKGAGWDFLGWAGTRKEVAMTDDEKAISESVLAKRKQLNEMRDKMRGEIRDKHSDMDKNSGLSGMSSQDEVNKHNQSKSEAERGIRAEYGDKISQIVPEVNIDAGTSVPPVEARKMGGPIKAGRPYLVGETGPELVVPNIGGQVITSERTEKIYKNLTSRKRGRGGVNVQTLPMITNQLPPPPVQLPSGGEATQVPDIASTNSSDRYRQLSASIYGIMV
jgi:hypothetical protein